jgi:hypothetical protein
MDFRRGRVGAVEGAEDSLEGLLGARAGGFGDGGGGAGARAGERDALLQEQEGGLELGVGQEAALHGLAVEQVVQGQQAHAAVVGHPRAHDGKGFAGGHAGGGVVHGFVEAEAADGAFGGEPLEVADGFARATMRAIAPA